MSLSRNDDPVRRWSTRTRGTALVGAGAAVLSLVWATGAPAPQESLEHEARLNDLLAIINAPETAREEPALLAPLDLQALEGVRLWRPRTESPPASNEVAVPPEPARPTLPPLALDLLAIVRESDGGFTAVVYNRSSDRLVTLVAGDEVDGRSVIGVDESSIRLHDGTRERKLSLAIEKWTLADALQDGVRRR